MKGSVVSFLTTAFVVAFAAVEPAVAGDDILQKQSATPEYGVIELRTNYANGADAMPRLIAREKKANAIREKHGIHTLLLLEPIDNPKNELLAVTGYRPSPTREGQITARDEAWGRMLADRAWVSIRRDSEAEGRILNAVREEFAKNSDFVPLQSESDPRDYYIVQCRAGTAPNLGLKPAQHIFATYDVTDHPPAGNSNVNARNLRPRSATILALPAGSKPPTLLDDEGACSVVGYKRIGAREAPISPAARAAVACDYPPAPPAPTGR